jgi:type I restriction enzyme S subunit
MKWESVEIGQLGEVITGNTPPRKNPELYGDFIPFIKPTDMEIDRRYTPNPEESYSELGFEKYQKSLIPKGSTCVVTIGSIGKKMTQAFTDCFINQAVNAVIPNENFDKDFIFYLLRNNLDKVKGSDSGTSSGRENVSKSAFSSIQVKVNKHLPTQRKIASILSAYDDLIENNLKRIKLLEEKAQLMHKSMQEDLAHAGKTNLYDFADIQMGFAFKAEAFNVVGEGIPIIRIRDIPNQITKSYTTQEVENQYWVEKGDLLIGMDGDFHMNEWLGQRGYLVQRVCRLRTKNIINQSYLWQALKEPIHYYQTTISGATVAHLGKKHLEEIFIYQPKASMKNELEELNTMRKLKIVLAKQNTKLREARDILLPRLMNGQIEV